VTVGWRKSYNEDCHNVCSSINIMKVIKVHRMKQGRHISNTKEMKNTCNIFVGNGGCFRTGCWGKYFNLKREEVAGGCKILHRELHNLYI